MIQIFILIAMLFCHVFDDFYLQGGLSMAKQKAWGQMNAAQPLYKRDYIAALIIHSFSWSFMIMLPIAIYLKFELGGLFLAYPVNAFIHALIDNAKANRGTINLIEDQIMHTGQIILTGMVFVSIFVIF